MTAAARRDPAREIMVREGVRICIVRPLDAQRSAGLWHEVMRAQDSERSKRLHREVGPFEVAGFISADCQHVLSGALEQLGPTLAGDLLIPETELEPCSCLRCVAVYGDGYRGSCMCDARRDELGDTLDDTLDGVPVPEGIR